MTRFKSELKANLMDLKSVIDTEVKGLHVLAMSREDDHISLVLALTPTPTLTPNGRKFRDTLLVRKNLLMNKTKL